MKSLGHSFALPALATALALLTASAQAAGAQASAKQHSTAKPVPLRSTTRLVEMSVVARDKHDQLVTDLRKTDFTVLDNGKPQTVQMFSVTTNRPLSSPPVPLPPNTYSNRVPGTGDAPANITVVLLDALNTPFSDQAFANVRVVKFLQQLQPQDRLALYALGSQLRILHDFTNDASNLLAALKGYKGLLSNLDNPEVPNLGSPGPMALLFTKDEEQYERETVLAKRVHLTLEAMLQIAKHVAPLPGRKNLIWVSGSFPLGSSYLEINPAHERILFTKDIANAAQVLADEAVVIYPVDARGLIPPEGDHFSAPNAFEFMTMKSLAGETGGRAFFNTNDIGGAIRAAIDDSRLSYELGYYPAIEKWDGSFHTVKVMVNRPGVHIRTRNGYLATPDPELTPETFKSELSEASLRLLESHAIELRVRVDDMKVVEGDSRTLTVDVLLDPRQLDLKLKNGRWAGIVNLLCVQLDDQYRVLHTLQQPYQLTLLPATYERPPAEGLKLTHVIEILPNAAQLRVILRDNSTGLAGAVGVPLGKYLSAKVPSDD